MVNKLRALEIPSTPDTYLDPQFTKVLEDHLTYLRDHEGTKRVAVDPMMIYKFDFDVRRLFREMKIPIELNWLVMRMSGLSNMHRLDESVKVLLVPDANKVSRILQVHRAQNKMD